MFENLLGLPPESELHNSGKTNGGARGLAKESAKEKSFELYALLFIGIILLVGWVGIGFFDSRVAVLLDPSEIYLNQLSVANWGAIISNILFSFGIFVALILLEFLFMNLAESNPPRVQIFHDVPRDWIEIENLLDYIGISILITVWGFVALYILGQITGAHDATLLEFSYLYFYMLPLFVWIAAISHFLLICTQRIAKNSALELTWTVIIVLIALLQVYHGYYVMHAAFGFEGIIGAGISLMPAFGIFLIGSFFFIAGAE